MAENKNKRGVAKTAQEALEDKGLVFEKFTSRKKEFFRTKNGAQAYDFDEFEAQPLPRSKRGQRAAKEEKVRTPRGLNKYTIYKVKEDTDLLSFLLNHVGVNRNKAKVLMSGRVIYLNNEIVTRFDTELKAGAEIKISKEKNKKEFHSNLLKIVYEDAYIIVIDKREGLLSIATDKQKERTAHSILNEYVQRSSKQHRVFIVHRLDRDTSGLMVFAKDEKTKRTLQDNWEKIVTDRRYVAVVSGDVEKDSGTITSYLMENKMYVTYSSLSNNGGDKAITNYKVIKRANGYSLVELELETGRKNQIRVHMQDIGNPVIGDEKYGNGVDPIGRLGLHAFKLWFYHPVSGELMKFETPYPSKFKTLLIKHKENQQ